jgi:hypothetical protein
MCQGRGSARPFPARSPVRVGPESPERYFTDINWDSGDLDLIDLQSGQTIPLTGRGYAADRNAWKSAFSSDGRRVAVEW